MIRLKETIQRYRTDESRAFEGMSNDDLDSIYAVAFGHWAYHMSREGYIIALNNKRKELNNGTIQKR